MSDLETQLRELLQGGAPEPLDTTRLVDGARRYAVRARRVRIAALVAVVAVVVGVGGAVAIGAAGDRALLPAIPGPTSSRTTTPPLTGPSWVTTATVADGKGHTFSLAVRVSITTPATSTPDASSPAYRSVTGPMLAGAYTLNNTSAADYDLSTQVSLLAYWKVPKGFCNRYNPLLVAGGIAIPRLSGGQELCPMAFGDSTLPSIPQTLRPRQPLSVTVEPSVIGMAQDVPTKLSAADAAVAVQVTQQAPAAWGAYDEELSTATDGRIASTGLPGS